MSEAFKKMLQKVWYNDALYVMKEELSVVVENNWCRLDMLRKPVDCRQQKRRMKRTSQTILRGKIFKQKYHTRVGQVISDLMITLPTLHFIADIFLPIKKKVATLAHPTCWTLQQNSFGEAYIRKHRAEVQYAVVDQTNRNVEAVVGEYGIPTGTTGDLTSRVRAEW